MSSTFIQLLVVILLNQEMKTGTCRTTNISLVLLQLHDNDHDCEMRMNNMIVMDIVSNGTEWGTRQYKHTCVRLVRYLLFHFLAGVLMYYYAMCGCERSVHSSLSGERSIQGSQDLPSCNRLCCTLSLPIICPTALQL